MLTIELKINGRPVAQATVVNDSALAKVSDYRVCATENASPVTGLSDFREEFRIGKHDREQSVWALAAKVAGRVADMRAR